MTNENLKSTTQVKDNIFDTKYLVDMLELLNNTDFKPSTSSNKAMIGMLPPLLVGIGLLPNVSSIAFAAAL